MLRKLRKRRRAGWYVGEMSPARREHDGPPLPTAVVCRSIAQHATTMFVPHFVGDACTMVLFRTGLIEALDY